MDEAVGGIGYAVRNMNAGRAMRRRGWNGKNMWIRLQKPDRDSKMTLPYAYMRTVTGELVPWLCSQTDLFAGDWEIVNDAPDSVRGPETSQP